MTSTETLTFVTVRAVTFVKQGEATIGTVRRTRVLDTVNMAGRAWVAERKGRRIPGTFPTRKAAAEALATQV